MSFRLYCIFLWLMLIQTYVKADIIPRPQQQRTLNGSFSLSATISVFIQDNYSAENLYAAQKINQALKARFGFTSYLTSKSKEADIILSMIEPGEVSKFGVPEEKLDEGYRLRISDEAIIIEAPYPQGIFYGAMTLAQLIDKAAEPSLKNMLIIDWPDFDFRGIADDISHGQVPTLETIKSQIDFLAKYKLNTYFLYLENALSLDEYPSSDLRPDAMSKNDIQELVKYASKNFIEVIPYFETLTRQEGTLMDNQFQKIAEFPGSGSLCLSCDYTYTYLGNILREIKTLFPSRYIYIGGEVSQDIGFGKSAALMDSLGSEGLHRFHFDRVKQICEKYNKQIIANEHILTQFPSLGKVIKPTFTVLDQPTLPVDGTISGQEIPDMFVFQQLQNDQWVFPNLKENRLKIQEAAEFARENHALGFCVSNQSSSSYESFKELLYYAYAWTGECAWNASPVDTIAFDEAFFEDFWRVADPLPAEIYSRFTEEQHLIRWKDFWRHPMLPLLHEGAQDEYPQNAKPLTASMKSIREAITQLRGSSSHKAKHLDVLSLMADIGTYYAFKRETQEKIQQYLKTDSKSDQLVNQLIALMEANILQLETLQEQYELTWQILYRPEALEFIKHKFKRLIYYFGECKDQLLIQRKLHSPLIQSAWIVDCDEIDSLLCKDTATFRKDFLLEKIPQRVNLQVMANTYAQVEVNGETVGEVSARESNFIATRFERAKIFDIKPMIKEGNNKVIIRVINYNHGLGKDAVFQGAALNASVMTRTGMRETYFHSGDDWLVVVYNDGKMAWKKASVREYPHPIIAPNFLSERTSWIED